jgi:hypothetical protein
MTHTISHHNLLISPHQPAFINHHPPPPHNAIGVKASAATEARTHRLPTRASVAIWGVEPLVWVSGRPCEQVC